MQILNVNYCLLSFLVFVQIIFVCCEDKKNETEEVQGRFGFGGFFGNRRNRRLRYNHDYDYYGPRYHRYKDYGGGGGIIFDGSHGRPYGNLGNPDRLTVTKKPPIGPSTSFRAEVNPPNCGETVEIPSQRIVGGRPAIDHEFPWQVSIQVNHLPTLRGEFSQYCGGAVLNERWIVTAAHCMTGVATNSMKGIIGANDISDLERSASEVTFDKIIIHEKYNDKNLAHKYDNDIALLRTKNKMALKSDKSVNAVCLPKKGQTFSGKVSVSGWGRVAEGGSKSEKLLTVDVPILDGKNCEKSYKTLFKQELMLCAGELAGGKDSCQADSGGPLVKIQGEKSYLVGIVSFGIGCARKGNPGTYTKVSNYVDWISQKVRENSK